MPSGAGRTSGQAAIQALTCGFWWAGTGSNRRPCGFQSFDRVCSDAEIRCLRCSVGIWQGKPEQGLAGFSLTATLTVDARWLVRTSPRPRKIRWKSPPSVLPVQLGLVANVLDDSLAKFRLGQALLHAGQRVPDDVTRSDGPGTEDAAWSRHRLRPPTRALAAVNGAVTRVARRDRPATAPARPERGWRLAPRPWRSRHLGRSGPAAPAAGSRRGCGGRAACAHRPATAAPSTGW
jgi:hypothetical protein